MGRLSSNHRGLYKEGGKKLSGGRCDKAAEAESPKAKVPRDVDAGWPLEAEKKQEMRSSLKSPVGTQPCQHLDFRLLTSRPVR